MKKSAAARKSSLFQEGSDNPTIIVKPADGRDPPPQLTESYPEPNRPKSSSWGLSMNMLIPVSTNDADRTHRVVDGDTLAAISQRYLSSPDRANEIFEANRDVLPTPEPLPIGVELKIPPRAKKPATAKSATPPTASP